MGLQVGLRVFFPFGRITEYSTILMLLLNDYYTFAIAGSKRSSRRREFAVEIIEVIGFE